MYIITTVHEFHKIATESNKKMFSVLHTNIQSLMHNFDSLQYLLTDLNHKFDIYSFIRNLESKEESPKL